MKTYPNSVDVYILLGEILANGENTSESIKYFDKALALAEHDDIPEIINLITESLFELDKDTEILAYYKNTSKPYPIIFLNGKLSRCLHRTWS